jgi:trimeric autotransporter adhesin
VCATTGAKIILFIPIGYTRKNDNSRLYYYPVLSINIKFTIMKSSQFLYDLAMLSVIAIFFPLLSFSQNVGIGIATPAFKLDVRNGSINTDSVYRIGGITVLSVKGSGNTFAGANSGISVTSGFFNTAIGYIAMQNNTTGTGNTTNGAYTLESNTTGSFNTATGYLALNSNSTGEYNTANGMASLTSNQSGSYNTATGYQALWLNNTGRYNTASGVDALKFNTEGSYNTATGVEALKNNTSGDFNAAHGYLSLYSNQGGVQNTAVGHRALFSNVSGGGNTAVGYLALANNQGGLNIGIGYEADVNPVSIINVIAIGANTTVTTSNTARFGNTGTVSYGGWAGWTNVSDGRFKKNIQENVPGLDFINKLRPVTYTLDASRLDKFYHQHNQHKTPLHKVSHALFETALQEKSQVIYTGFIAQEVEAAAKQLGFDFSGVDAAKNEHDTYGLRYAEFVVPLVKAVQEQQTMIETLKKQNELLQQRIEKLEHKN